MIKRTLYFGNPAYLSLKLNQLVIKKPDDRDLPVEGDKGSSGKFDAIVKTIPVEDIGIIVLDNKQITITQALMAALLENNSAIITCDSSHLPTGMFLPLFGNIVQSERFREQIEASLPLKKQLWQQTIVQKIRNQAATLNYSTGEEHGIMYRWAGSVRSGDSENIEAKAAVYYWKTIFPNEVSFIRDRVSEGPNIFLNYGYSILRAIIARALVCSGLLPTLGIHHHNRYDAYCLADDIMEPYRPYVDKLILDMLNEGFTGEITHEAKARLLSIPTLEVTINGRRSPLMVAASTTTTSLYKCFCGESRKLLYPEMIYGQV